MADLSIDDLLKRYESEGSDIERAWLNLCTSAVGLGAALARFDLACDRYVEAKRRATI